MPAWLGWVAVVLLSLYLAVYPAVAAGLAWRWAARQPVGAGPAPRRRLDRRPNGCARPCSPASPGTRSASTWSTLPVARPGDADRHLRPVRALTMLAGGALLAARARRHWQRAAAPSSLPIARRRAAALAVALHRRRTRRATRAPHRPAQYRPAGQMAAGLRARRISQRFVRLSGAPGAGAAPPALAGGGDRRYYLAYDPEARAAEHRRVCSAPRDLLLLGGDEPIVRRRPAARSPRYNSVFVLRPDGQPRSAATTRRISFPMANICRCGRS